MAYAVGLITADGCLSNDGRHIDFTSKDKEQVDTFKKCLNLRNIISQKSSGYSRNKLYYRIQFGDVVFYRWLIDIGLTSRKSLTMKSLKVPDRYYFDFLRGYFDGDGTVWHYRDKRWKNSYLLVSAFYSGSKCFLDWIQKTTYRLGGFNGDLRPMRQRAYELKYYKRETHRLMSLMYHSPELRHLKRKRQAYLAFCSIER